MDQLLPVLIWRRIYCIGMLRTFTIATYRVVRYCSMF